MTPPLRIGIIGSGSIAELHVNACNEVGTEIVACCDLDAARAEKLAGLAGGADAITDADQLLARDDIEAVVVSVPNAVHREMAVRALQAGKDVLLEKPMAVNAGECDRIIDALRETDRILQVGFVCRGTPAALAAKTLVESGRLGRIYHARAALHRHRGIPGLGRWFTNRATAGGGVLIDVGVHFVDLLLELTGRPTPQRACAVTDSRFGVPVDGYRFDEMWSGPPNPAGVFDVEDSVTALVRFESMAMELSLAWAVNMPMRYTRDGVLLLGDRAGLYFDVFGDRLYLSEAIGGGEPVDAEETFPVTNAWTEAFARQAAGFAHNVRTRTPPAASAENGREVQAILDALYRSADSGAEVGLGEAVRQ